MLGSNWNNMPMANNNEELLVFPPDLRFPTNGEVNQEEQLVLPPGYRFHPTDGEVIDDYLEKKIANPNLTTIAMGDVDLNKCEPWDLPSQAKMGEKEWYFFAQKDMKYPTGTRANRATKSGYWKATGKDKEIFSFRTFGKTKKKVLVGMKKTLVFYMGRAPRGEKTNWVMHEFRLADDSSSKVSARDGWVVCRVTEKKNASSNNRRINQPVEPDTSNSNQPVDETKPSNSCDDHDIMNILSDPASDLPLLVNSNDIPGSSSTTASVEPSSAMPNMPMFPNLPGMTGFPTQSNTVLLPNNFSSRDNQVRVNHHWVDSQYGYGNLGFIQNQETDISMFPMMYNFSSYQ